MCGEYGVMMSVVLCCEIVLLCDVCDVVLCCVCVECVF